MKEILEQVEVKDDKEKVTLSGPRLRYIKKTLELLRPIENELGGEINWKELYKEVKPWSTALELSDNIRDVVRDYVVEKVPVIRESIHSIDGIEDLSDQKLIDALAHNWFDTVEGMDGKRIEILLTVAAQVVKRIETLVYKRVLDDMTDGDFENKLGIDLHLKGLLGDLLDVSQRADPLFVRFSAFLQLTPEPPVESKSESSEQPPEEIPSTGILIPGSKRPRYTIASLFPHESLSISKNLLRIADNSSNWEDLPGADAFKTYLRAQSGAYGETDPQKALEYLEYAEKLYEELLASGFPIILSSGTSEGEPYVDPELKVSISTPDTRQEEAIWNMAKEGMANSLDSIGAGEFSDIMRAKIIRSVISIGGHGANLTLNAVAEQDPGILVFLNDQIRTYDRSFPEFMSLVTNRDVVFPDSASVETRSLMERMSRSNSVHHELAHDIYSDSSGGARRMGDEMLKAIDEVKAETLYRTLVPSMVESASLAGSKEQWAVAMLTSSMQMLRDQAADDTYYAAAVFTLDSLFSEGAVKFFKNKIEIVDFDKFYEINKTIAEEVLGLYRDEQMTEEKAEKWIRQRCRPNKQVKALEKFLKKKFKLTNEIENN